MTQLFLHFWNVSCAVKNWAEMTRISNTWFGSGASFAFELHCSLQSIPPVGIISLQIRICAIVFNLDWLNSNRFGFTLLLLHAHKGWTAVLVRCLLQTTAMCSAVNCAWATSYNYNATITFFLIAQWTSDTKTLNVSCATICNQPPVQVTGLLGVWMQRGDLKIT